MTGQCKDLVDTLKKKSLIQTRPEAGSIRDNRTTLSNSFKERNSILACPEYGARKSVMILPCGHKLWAVTDLCTNETTFRAVDKNGGHQNMKGITASSAGVVIGGITGPAVLGGLTGVKLLCMSGLGALNTSSLPVAIAVMGGCMVGAVVCGVAVSLHIVDEICDCKGKEPNSMKERAFSSLETALDKLADCLDSNIEKVETMFSSRNDSQVHEEEDMDCKYNALPMCPTCNVSPNHLPNYAPNSMDFLPPPAYTEPYEL
eukprot:CFRG6651T1